MELENVIGDKLLIDQLWLLTSQARSGQDKRRELQAWLDDPEHAGFISDPAVTFWVRQAREVLK